MNQPLEMNSPVETTDGSMTLFSDRYQETYHSIHGAETESRHIFLEASGVADKLRLGDTTNVLEIGFGLGLNCLLTADLAAQFNATLSFTSVELHLLSPEKLAELNYQSILKSPQLASRLVAALNDDQQLANDAALPPTSPPTSPTSSPTRLPRRLPIKLDNNINLELLLGDSSTMGFQSKQYDAIYLDAFSPDTNPECWSLSFFEKLIACLKSNGILTTYSSKGVVRRALQEVGFQVEKLPGPPGKREFLVARTAIKT